MNTFTAFTVSTPTSGKWIYTCTNKKGDLESALKICSLYYLKETNGRPQRNEAGRGITKELNSDQIVITPDEVRRLTRFLVDYVENEYGMTYEDIKAVTLDIV